MLYRIPGGHVGIADQPGFFVIIFSCQPPRRGVVPFQLRCIGHGRSLKFGTIMDNLITRSPRVQGISTTQNQPFSRLLVDSGVGARANPTCVWLVPWVRRVPDALGEDQGAMPCPRSRQQRGSTGGRTRVKKSVMFNMLNTVATAPHCSPV